MANWCSNTVEFTANKRQLIYLQRLFEKMLAKERETGNGQLPPFLKIQEGWLFDIYWDNGVLIYETKWSPNTDVLIAIANHYSVGFTYNYSEMGMCIYGEAHYENYILTDTYLEDGDFARYGYNEETDDYTFDGETYKYDNEILEILLERKK